MANNETNWKTVPGKGKGKTTASSTKSSAAPVIPKVEIKSIFKNQSNILFN